MSNVTIYKLKFTCPVCKGKTLEKSAYDKNDLASFEICPKCHFQFGVNDDIELENGSFMDRMETHHLYYKNWAKEKITQLTEWINEASHVVFFTGAGMSTASGIPDFRSTNGIWTEGENREYYISQQYFHSNPKDFWKRYKEIFQIKIMGDYKPNDGHIFIKELEDKGKQITVLTQNVDNLHKDAGSGQVIELHGSIKSATCPKCKSQYGLETINNEDVPRCHKLNSKNQECGCILKPEVVLFGDDVKGYKEAERIVEESTLFIVLGSSLQVYPVNQLPEYAKRKRNKLVIINREATEKDDLFDLVIHSDINEVLSVIKESWSKQVDEK